MNPFVTIKHAIQAQIILTNAWFYTPSRSEDILENALLEAGFCSIDRVRFFNLFDDASGVFISFIPDNGEPSSKWPMSLNMRARKVSMHIYRNLTFI